MNAPKIDESSKDAIIEDLLRKVKSLESTILVLEEERDLKEQYSNVSQANSDSYSHRKPRSPQVVRLPTTDQASFDLCNSKSSDLIRTNDHGSIGRSLDEFVLYNHSSRSKGVESSEYPEIIQNQNKNSMNRADTAKGEIMRSDTATALPSCSNESLGRSKGDKGIDLDTLNDLDLIPISETEEARALARDQGITREDTTKGSIMRTDTAKEDIFRSDTATALASCSSDSQASYGIDLSDTLNELQMSPEKGKRSSKESERDNYFHGEKSFDDMVSLKENSPVRNQILIQERRSSLAAVANMLSKLEENTSLKTDARASDSGDYRKKSRGRLSPCISPLSVKNSI